MAKENLKTAKVEKNDEFYTQMSDIENEIRHYRNFFEGKTVFCNCDDPFESNFFKYFAMNFNFLKLKKLICTCYAGSPISHIELNDSSFFNQNKDIEKMPYMIQINEVSDQNGDGAVDMADIEALLRNDKNLLTILDGDGDFRSEESIGWLKESDIVVTNPPFSLFREYIAQLIKYDKKFIILSNMNALHYKEIFPLVQNNKIWIGYGFNLSMVYKTPYPNLLESNRKFVISKGYDPDEGYVKVPGICWFTNLDIDIRHEKMILYKKYNEKDYPKFDNFDAINVNHVADIPEDYTGVMGVPDSFLNQYHPDEFEILGRSGDTEWVFNDCDFFTPPSDDLIRKYKKQNKTWRLQNVYLLDENKNPIITYSRIFIRRKQ